MGWFDSGVADVVSSHKIKLPMMGKVFFKLNNVEASPYFCSNPNDPRL